MKKLTASMAIALVICFLISVAGEYGSVVATQDKIIRLHVIANSDSEKDQNIKLLVRDEILSVCDGILSGTDSKDEAMSVILNNLGLLSERANSLLEKFGQSASVTLQKESFEKRIYENFTLPAGEYDSLCIRIGNASGKNWWCVCYPSLCLPSATKFEREKTLTPSDVTLLSRPEKVRYKLWCYELVLKLKKFFK